MTLPKQYQKLVALQAHEDLRQACQVQNVDLTPPEPDEILVKTSYAGVNAADYLIAQNRYLAATPPPHDLGSEATGVVVAVGEAVDNFRVGDAMMTPLSGGFREYFTMSARYAIPVPHATADLVTLGVSGLTASIALDELGELRSGETVLVTAAAGGTGNFAVQLAKIAGNHVIGTCSSADKVDFLRSLGCDRPINYREEDLKTVLKAEYPNGLDIVFEGVGGEQYDIALNRLAVRGRLIVIGSISEYKTGAQKEMRLRDSSKLVGKSASIRGFWLMHYLRDAAKHTQKLLGLVQEGKLKLSTDPTTFKGVTGAIEALEYMYQGQNLGKVVVDFT